VGVVAGALGVGLAAAGGVVAVVTAAVAVDTAAFAAGVAMPAAALLGEAEEVVDAATPAALGSDDDKPSADAHVAPIRYAPKPRMPVAMTVRSLKRARNIQGTPTSLSNPQNGEIQKHAL
ncbi:MAG: hypothetical protein WAL63_17885, partial [Solirubrobacteraceae bacterium]